MGKKTTIAAVDPLLEYLPQTDSLPEQWAVCNIGKVVEETLSGDWGDEEQNEGLVPCYALRGTDFQKAHHGSFVGVPVRFVGQNSIAKRRLVPGDILVELSGGSKDQATGRVFLATEANLVNASVPVLFTNFVKRLRIKTRNTTSEFFYRFWQHLYQMRRTFVYEKRTTGIRNFKLADFLGNEFIALPPLPEQQAIAQVLQTVQRAKEATEKVIAASRQLKKSLMRHLFTYGPVPFDQADMVNLKESETGSMPNHWNLVGFEDFAVLQRGQDLPRYDFKEGSVPVVGATSFIGYHNVANVRGPGVTVVRSGSSAGKPLFVDRDFWAHNVVLYVKNFHGNNVKFVFYKLLTLKLMQYKAGVAVPTLNRNTFKNILVDVPPRDEQDEIVRLLDAVEAKIVSDERRRNALVTLFNTLLHQLMTGKVRVV